MGIKGHSSKDKGATGDIATESAQQAAAEAKEAVAQQQAELAGDATEADEPRDQDKPGEPRKPQDFRGH